jgi:hypothetical protein
MINFIFFNGVYWQIESKSNSKLHLFVGKEYYESFIKLYPNFKEEMSGSIRDGFIYNQLDLRPRIMHRRNQFYGLCTNGYDIPFRRSARRCITPYHINRARWRFNL